MRMFSFARASSAVGAMTVTLQTGSDHLMKAAIEVLQWPTGGRIILYVSWLERKRSVQFLWHLCLVAWNLENLPGQIHGSDLIFSVFFLRERKNNNYQIYYHLQCNYRDLDSSAIF